MNNEFHEETQAFKVTHEEIGMGEERKDDHELTMKYEVQDGDTEMTYNLANSMDIKKTIRKRGRGSDNFSYSIELDADCEESVSGQLWERDTRLTGAEREYCKDTDNTRKKSNILINNNFDICETSLIKLNPLIKEDAKIPSYPESASASITTADPAPTQNNGYELAQIYPEQNPCPKNTQNLEFSESRSSEAIPSTPSVSSQHLEFSPEKAWLSSQNDVDMLKDLNQYQQEYLTTKDDCFQSDESNTTSNLRKTNTVNNSCISLPQTSVNLQNNLDSNYGSMISTLNNLHPINHEKTQSLEQSSNSNGSGLIDLVTSKKIVSTSTLSSRAETAPTSRLEDSEHCRTKQSTQVKPSSQSRSFEDPSYSSFFLSTKQTLAFPRDAENLSDTTLSISPTLINQKASMKEKKTPPVVLKDALSSPQIDDSSQSSDLIGIDLNYTIPEGPELSPENSKDDMMLAELKAIKIASITARNHTLEAELVGKRMRLEEVSRKLQAPAAETVRRHIKLLHDYNDIRDIGQGLIGMIAEQRGVQIASLYEDFGVGVRD